jgi:hypothetical protein
MGNENLQAEVLPPEEERRASRAFSKLGRRVAVTAGAAALLVPMSAGITSAQTQQTSISPANTVAYNCSCVLYVRSQTGLPGGPATAADYTEHQMNAFGYQRVLPQAGAIFVWDRWQKGAEGAGHMALINSAGYNNQAKKWVISVRHVNWAGNCNVTQTTFSWGDLYGVNAYVRK